MFPIIYIRNCLTISSMMMEVWNSHGKWGVPKHYLKWEVVPDQPVCWETQINLLIQWKPQFSPIFFHQKKYFHLCLVEGRFLKVFLVTLVFDQTNRNISVFPRLKFCAIISSIKWRFDWSWVTCILSRTDRLRRTDVAWLSHFVIIVHLSVVTASLLVIPT